MQELDPAVLAVLPAGCEVVGVYPHGAAQWASSFKVEVEVDGEEKEYFLKVIQRPRHAEMALGEYESQKALQQYLPDNVCIPLAHGTFELEPNTSFFLTTFRYLTDKIPEPAQFVEVFEKLHKNSISPTGKYGFHVSTFNGWVPLVNDWCDTWEEWFARQFRSDISWEQGIRGEDPDFNQVADEFFEKVIPRLLRPLETGGRSIRPVLLHGDVYEGNVKIDEETQQVVIYDSCCCYGHNELDLCMLRLPRYRLSWAHLNKYKETVRPSEPVEDFEDRITLYSLRDEIINSGLHEHRAHHRQL